MILKVVPDYGKKIDNSIMYNIIKKIFNTEI